MSLLDGLKDEMINPLRLANDEFSFGEAMEQDLVLEAATNAKLSDEDIAAILGGDDDIPSDDDPEGGDNEALIEETAIECFCASAYAYNDIVEEGFIKDLSDKFKNWWAYRKDRKVNLKARTKLREELQFKVTRTKVDDVLKDITNAAKGILIDMTDTELADAKRKVQITGDQNLHIKKVNGIRFIAVSNENGYYVNAIGCIDGGALIKVLEEDPLKEMPKWMMLNKNDSEVQRIVVDFDAEFVAILLTAPIVPNDNDKGVMATSIESMLDSLPSAEGETPEEIMAVTEAMLGRLPIETQMYLDDVATEGLKEKIQGMKDAHEAKKLDKAKLTVLTHQLKGMKPESVVRKFVAAGKAILLPMNAEDKNSLMDDASNPQYLKVSGIDIVYYLSDDGSLAMLYAAYDPEKLKKGQGVWGKKGKNYNVETFNLSDIAKMIQNPAVAVQAAAEEGWNEDGIEPDSPVMEHLLDMLLQQR
ncbi:MAG: hypothetical protein NC548_05765 [Lachnospiraceae bacterium]|nr:hypothetical protein [Lachnospiraceae bacterium]